MTDDQIKLLRRYKAHLTNDHIIDGRRVSVAPCIGGSAHRELVPLEKGEVFQFYSQSESSHWALSWWDVYRKQKIRFGDDFLYVYECAKRGCTEGWEPDGDYFAGENSLTLAVISLAESYSQYKDPEL